MAWYTSVMERVALNCMKGVVVKLVLETMLAPVFVVYNPSLLIINWPSTFNSAEVRLAVVRLLVDVPLTKCDPFGVYLIGSNCAFS